MIVDSSVVLAVLLGEPDAMLYASAMADAQELRMSAPNWFEAAMVAESRGGSQTAREFSDFITAQNIEVVAFGPEHAEVARDAWRKYGRGRHPAKLNFGDCMSYALATIEARPLLFKGADFPQTDIEPALKG